MTSLQPVRGDAAELLALLRSWEAADGEPAPLVVETSGSTGRPKRVVLSRAAMRASASATHRRLGGPGQWVLGLPPTHVAGVQVLFRSVLAGTEPLLLDPGRAGWGEARSAMTGPRAYVSLVPTQLHRALAGDGAGDGAGRGAGDGAGRGAGDGAGGLAGFDAVLVGGGPLDPGLRAAAEGRGVRVVQTYGMSETCGGCVYDGHPLDGVAVKVASDGQVWLAGPVLFDGYEGDPERTAAVLRDGWFRTDDLGTLDDDGRLRVLGRADDMVVSGGLKVPAEAVAAALRAHPSVADAHVLGVPDPEWGERVVAVVEPVGAPPSLADLRDAVTPRTWAPRGLVLVESLPRLANGKVDRVAVQRLVGGRTPREGADA